MSPADDVNTVLARVQLLLPRSAWKTWPGGWPDQIELAVVDAVFSVRANYGGVLPVVKKWKAAREGDADDLKHLAEWGRGSDALADLLGNHQRLPGGVLKAEACISVASALMSIGVRHAAQLQGSDIERRAWTGVRGLGPVTWHYLLLLLGRPDVKADVMILSFLSGALGRSVHPEEGRRTVIEVAEALGESPALLDHAIWDYERRHRGQRQP